MSKTQLKILGYAVLITVILIAIVYAFTFLVKLFAVLGIIAIIAAFVAVVYYIRVGLRWLVKR